jgi:hypothetical protein
VANGMGPCLPMPFFVGTGKPLNFAFSTRVRYLG